MRDLDLWLFRWINGGPDWLEPLMVFLSLGNKWLWVRLLLLAVFVFYLVRPALRKPALLSMLAWPIANAACDWLKAGLRLPRPTVELSDAIVRIDRLTSFGSASAHSATMMSIAAVFLFYNRSAGIAWLVVALLTGYSRVYNGVHYPYQVLLGWFVGGFVGFVAVKTWQSWERLRSSRRQGSEQPAADPSDQGSRESAGDGPRP